MYQINPCVIDITLDNQNICNLCKKKVVNLTHLSDAEIDLLIKNSSDGICGSGSSSRINTSYYLNPFRIFAMAIIIVFGSSMFILDASAQDTIQQIKKEVLNSNPQPNELSTLITGSIINKETKESMPFVSIWVEINSIKIGAATDLDGQFKIRISNDIITDTQTLTLYSRNIGFAMVEQKQLIIKGKENKAGVIELIDLGELFPIVGMMVPYNQLETDPDAHRKTTIKRKDIEKSPRKD